MGRKEPNRKQGEETKQSRWGFRGMTVRNWLELLIVPLVLVGIGLLFEMQQQQALEERRAEAERELAEQRAQDEALQAYLTQMSTLLLEKDLRNSEDSEVRTLARARTLTVLGRLDPSRKTALMQFLVEADLVQRVDERDPIIILRGADLSGANLNAFANLRNADLSFADLSNADLEAADLRDANLSEANLIGVDLSGAGLDNANLRYANLSNATLRYAIFRNADLRFADLSNATLRGANLSDANLSDARLSHANLRNANLRRADLGGGASTNVISRAANLSGADLSDADLSGADLSGSTKFFGEKGIITNEELEQQPESLHGATMPNGQKYEDWLKSKGKGEK